MDIPTGHYHTGRCRYSLWSSSGEVITPLTISLVVGSAISGIIIGKFQRYQLITILGSLVLTVGVFFMTLWTSSTSLCLRYMRALEQFGYLEKELSMILN